MRWKGRSQLCSDNQEQHFRKIQEAIRAQWTLSRNLARFAQNYRNCSQLTSQKAQPWISVVLWRVDWSEMRSRLIFPEEWCMWDKSSLCFSTHEHYSTRIVDKAASSPGQKEDLVHTDYVCTRKPAKFPLNSITYIVPRGDWVFSSNKQLSKHQNWPSMLGSWSNAIKFKHDDVTKKGWIIRCSQILVTN